MAILLPFRGKEPEISEDAFVAPNAVVIGDVRIEAGASVWFGAVLRGDDPTHGIRVGPDTNVQDGAVIHVGDWGPTVLGARVTVGHGAVMECCEIGDGALIGMRAVVLQNVVVGEESLIAAGSVVLEGTRVPPRSLVAGIPGQVRRSFDDETPEWITRSWGHYRELSRQYLAEGVGVPRLEAARAESFDG